MSVSLSVVKSFLNITHTRDDDELIDTIDRASAVIANRVGPLTPTAVTNEMHWGPGPIVLNRRPVVSITSITGDGETLTGYTFDPSTGLIHGWFGRRAYGVKVSYVAGWSVLPADLEAAVLELTKHLWESQRVPAVGRPGFGGNESDSLEVNPGARYLLPYRVQTLLEPYLTTVVA